MVSFTGGLLSIPKCKSVPKEEFIEAVSMYLRKAPGRIKIANTRVSKHLEPGDELEGEDERE